MNSSRLARLTAATLAGLALWLALFAIITHNATDDAGPVRGSVSKGLTRTAGGSVSQHIGYLTVTGLSDFQIASVRNSAGRALASAAARGGTAVIDLHSVAIQDIADVAVYETKRSIPIAFGVPEDGIVAGGDVWHRTAVGAFAETEGVWSWWDDPRAIRHVGNHDRTYFGAVLSNGDVVVRSFDHSTGEVGGTIIHSGLQVDDHNVPSLRVRYDGRLQAFWSAHSGREIFYRTTTNPEDVSSWSERHTLTSHGPFTYPSPADLSDRVVLHWRRDAPPQYQYYRESQDNGATWGTPKQLTSARSPYLKFARHPTELDRIDYFVSDDHPRTGNPSLYHFYRAGSAFYRSDGTGIGEPPFALVSLTSVWDAVTDGHGGWQWDIFYDASGCPVVLFVRFVSTLDHRLMYGRWNGSEWIVSEVAAIGGAIAEVVANTSENHYSAGAALDPVDPTRVWVAKSHTGGHSAGLWEYYTQDGGMTWMGLERIAGTIEENIRPFVPRGGRHDSAAVLFLRGTYHHYTDYQTRISALPATAATTATLLPSSTDFAGVCRSVSG